MNTIRVFEFEKLSIHPDARGNKLTQEQLDRLYDFNDRNNNIYFTSQRDGIRFLNYVGVIQVGGLTIEILPKTDRNPHSDESEYARWQKVLLDMLSLSKYLKVSTVSETYLEKRYNSILDMYFEIFLDEVFMLLRKGLIKQYRKESGNLFALKGKLQFSNHIQKNLVHAERFFTEHQIYDHEHIINQILLKALVLLKRLYISQHLRDKINRIMLDFPEISEVEIHSSDFHRLKETRKTVVYNKSIQIAKMIILNYSPDIRGGNENMIALLFDMNKLWENYIYQMLLKVKMPDMEILYNTSEKFWEQKTIRPDIVIKKGNAETLIIDTKWKIIKPEEPADDDLKQMFAYNIYWNVEKSILLYPQTTDCHEKFGTFHRGIRGSSQCKPAFVNILNEEGRLNAYIGEEILKKFE